MKSYMYLHKISIKIQQRAVILLGKSESKNYLPCAQLHIKVYNLWEFYENRISNEWGIIRTKSLFKIQQRAVILLRKSESKYYLPYAQLHVKVIRSVMNEELSAEEIC